MPFISRDNLSILSDEIDRLYENTFNEYTNEMSKPPYQMDYKKIRELQEKIKIHTEIDNLITFLKKQEK